MLAGSAPAQKLGFGAGLAVPNDQIAQVPSDIVADGWTAITQRAESGYFLELRGRIGGDVAAVGGIGYNRFHEATTTYRDGSGRSVDLITSQVIVPLSLGVERRFSDGIISPYVSLEGTFNYFYRAFEAPREGVNVPTSFESSGDARIGAAAGAGVSLDLSLIKLDVGARGHLVNLMNAEPGEKSIVFAQLGATLYLGL